MPVMERQFDAIIIGGGPAGSSSAIGLASAGMNVVLVEKHAFPRETLCGEFLSLEVASALREFGLFSEFLSLGPSRLTDFAFIPEWGRTVEHRISFEAWSLKRSLFDQLLLKRASEAGANIVQPAEVISITRTDAGFEVNCRTGQKRLTISGRNVIGAYGKHHQLDSRLGRNSGAHRSPMTGIKYHVPLRFFPGLEYGTIRLFSARGAYCGLSRVNTEEATLCALVDGHPMNGLLALWRENKGFRQMLDGDLMAILRRLHPYGASNIFFGRKAVVENGIYMVGDAAGMIAPLAGDGIGMAIEGGRLVARVLTRAHNEDLGRSQTEALFEKEWQRLFRNRISFASRLQRLVMNPLGGATGAALMRAFPGITVRMFNRTRGSSGHGSSVFIGKYWKNRPSRSRA